MSAFIIYNEIIEIIIMNKAIKRIDIKKYIYLLKNFFKKYIILHIGWVIKLFGKNKHIGLCKNMKIKCVIFFSHKIGRTEQN